jgi:hypothetical protein
MVVPSSTAAAPPPLSIAIIGCGAGGMFFCHALETYKNELNEKRHNGDDLTNPAGLPSVCCFERAAGPGGVWRAKRTFATTVKEDEKKREDHPEEEEALVAGETTNMYEALWTNGAKDGIEFFDYTFQEHFGGPLPVYMPRQALLDYMVTRVTRKCPDFFEKYVKFNTNVVSVRYRDNKFEIVTCNNLTQQRTTSYFDKCIWAAGDNGMPMMPASIVSLFQEGGFPGRILHSSDTADFEQHVKNKRILLIGGSYSAEDLTLMAIKCGAERIYISSRQTENVVSWTSSWPGDKVEILYGQIPVQVDGSTVQFAKTDWEFPDKYIPTDGMTIQVEDIDTVLFCTGYRPNFCMLDPELRAAFDKPYENKLQVPSDWRMSGNEWTEALGEVVPAEEGVYWGSCPTKFPGIYRGMLISNPSMIFLENEDFANPIFGVEANAWILMRFLTGTREIPSADEMKRQNEEDCLRQLQNPYLRYYMDRNYYDAYNENYDKISSESWNKYEKEYSLIYYRIMARQLNEADYPGVRYGTYDDLNEIAMTIFDYGYLSYYHRTNLDPNNQDEKEWRTFRDYTDGDKFHSIFTGTAAVNLNKRWLDIDSGKEMEVIQSSWTTK